MQFILDLLNSALVISIIGATLLESIRQRYQRAAKENAQKVEWLKQTRVEQSKLFNELSNLTASVVGDSQMLFKELADNMNSSFQDAAELKEREQALLSSILKWEQSYLSIRNRIQQLTYSDSDSQSDSTAVKLFIGDFRTEISETLKEKIAQETTLASAISILCNKTLSYLRLFRKTMPLKNEAALEDSTYSPISYGLSANIAMGTACPSEEDIEKPEPPEIAKLSENERTERLAFCRNKITQMLSSKDDMMKWLLDNRSGTALCNTKSRYLLERFDKENYTALLRLEMQKDMFALSEAVENKINTFFNTLNQGFQEHLDTAEKHIIK